MNRGNLTSETVNEFLRVWDADGRPGLWHLAPILADAVEESGLNRPAVLTELRRGRMRWNGTGESLFGDDQIAIALGLMPADLLYWASPFGYAGEPDTGITGSVSIAPALPGDDVSVEPFTRSDVVEVLASSEGENDERNWLCVGRLRDGRWFALDAGCDYTGWG